MHNHVPRLEPGQWRAGAFNFLAGLIASAFLVAAFWFVVVRPIVGLIG